MVLRTPEALQVLVLRKLERKYSLRQIEKIFIQLARTNISRNDPHAAAAAFVLARKPFAAAKVYIDFGGLEFIPAAIQILDRNQSLIHDRDQAIRNLARHAYNKQKYMEAAELLNTIGAEEEANTVLIAAATEMRKQGLSIAKLSNDHKNIILEKVAGSTCDLGNPVDYWPPERFVGTKICEMKKK